MHIYMHIIFNILKNNEADGIWERILIKCNFVTGICPWFVGQF